MVHRIFSRLGNISHQNQATVIPLTILLVEIQKSAESSHIDFNLEHSVPSVRAPNARPRIRNSPQFIPVYSQNNHTFRVPCSSTKSMTPYTSSGTRLVGIRTPYRSAQKSTLQSPCGFWGKSSLWGIAPLPTRPFYPNNLRIVEDYTHE